ncbi:unnamed protein product [Cylindrotheca closterium]|uniref:Uncharacterized protein n=1 Tax=Cylindrotheca closterium TaxID=2856 RepID=A0AAD2CGU6_9STRA|nr:unnamed protein product [Cylindrotheca closterium]
MASMGPFPSERVGRDIDDLPIWQDWDSYPCEWNEFYCSKSWNISPVEFAKVSISPPSSPLAKKVVVKKRRSSKTLSSKRRSSNGSISSDRSRKSSSSSVKSKKKKKGSSSASTPKSEKKKKKSKKDRKSSASVDDSVSTLNSATNQESSTEFSSSSFRCDKLQSASFSCLSPSLNHDDSITGCDLTDDNRDHITRRPQSESQLAETAEGPSKKVKKKKKTKTKDQKSPRKEKVTEKKPQSTRSPKAKTTVTMETLPEEVLVSMNHQGLGRGLARSLSPKRTTSHSRFSKLMVVADGSIRRAVDRKKGSFWEQQSSKRRGSVRQSIHSALGEFSGEIDDSLHLFDEDNSSRFELESKTAERSICTEITDPWNNSWSVSSDSFHDNSERLKSPSLLLSKSPEVEHIKRINPL